LVRRPQTRADDALNDTVGRSGSGGLAIPVRQCRWACRDQLRPCEVRFP